MSGSGSPPNSGAGDASNIGPAMAPGSRCILRQVLVQSRTQPSTVPSLAQGSGCRRPLVPVSSTSPSTASTFESPCSRQRKWAADEPLRSARPAYIDQAWDADPSCFVLPPDPSCPPAFDATTYYAPSGYAVVMDGTVALLSPRLPISQSSTVGAFTRGRADRCRSHRRRPADRLHPRFLPGRGASVTTPVASRLAAPASAICGRSTAP